MADKIEFNTIYDERHWSVLYGSAVDERPTLFLAQCNKVAVASEFPNIELREDDFSSGGIFSSESTRMLSIRPKKSNFKSLAAYFRVKTFGRLAVYSQLRTIDHGFFEGTDADSRIASIKSK